MLKLYSNNISWYLEDPLCWVFGLFFLFIIGFAIFTAFRFSKLKCLILCGMSLLALLVSVSMYNKHSLFIYFSINYYVRLDILEYACFISAVLCVISVAVTVLRLLAGRKKRD